MLHIAACHDSVDIVKMSLEAIPVNLQDQVMLLHNSHCSTNATVEWRDCIACGVQVGQ